MNKTIKTMLPVFVAMAAFANAATISVNMTDGGGGVSSDGGSTGGAALAANWNNILRGGTAGTGTNLGALKNDAGAATTVTLSQSTGVGGAFNGASLFSGTIGNAFMTNYSDTTGSYTYTFTNLNAEVGALYDVYIYSARGFTNAGVSQFTVDGADQFILNESMVGDYTLATNTASAVDANANKNEGNYVLFKNVSLDTLVIGVTGGIADTTGNGGNIANINGVQIVQVPEPSSTALLGLGGVALLLRRRK